jgi:elongation factor Ts
MNVTPEQVKTLRERTGAGIMECKRALEKAGGDLDHAVQTLREEGAAKADKKIGRAAGEGLVGVCVAPGGDVGALVELNCETDFVARTDRFAALAAGLAEQLCAEGTPPDLSAFLDRPAWRGPGGQTVGQLVKEAIAALGENIVLRRADRLALDTGAPGGLVAAYLHAGGKIGVLVELAAGSAAAAGRPEVAGIARDLAMQVAAMSPRWVRREEVPAEVLEGERAILRAQPDLQGKPPGVQEKMVQGRLHKFYGEACLLDQVFIKDDARKATVGDVLKATGKAVGADLSVRRFCRFKVGEAN